MLEPSQIAIIATLDRIEAKIDEFLNKLPVSSTRVDSQGEER